MLRLLQKRLGRGVSGASGNIWRMCAFSVLNQSIILTIPVIVLFWNSLGLEMFEIAILQAIFAVAVVLLEVPSGYAADLLGRKAVIVIGSTLVLFGTTAYVLAGGFNSCVIAELFYAVGVSLISGADEALIYDTLLEQQREAEFTRILGRNRFLMLIFMAVGSALGGALSFWGLRVPFYAALAGDAVALAVACSLREPTRSKLQAQGGHWRELWSIGRHCLYENRSLRWVLVYAGLVMGVLNTTFWFYQPYFKACGLQVAANGLIYAGLNVVAAVAAARSDWLGRKLGERGGYLLMLGLILASLLLQTVVFSLVGVAIIMMQQIVRGYGMTAFSGYVNNHTSSDVRATTLSLKNMVTRALYVATLIPMGWIVDHIGLASGVAFLALVTAIVGVLLLRLPRHCAA